jgi:hypothetical protein
MPLCKKSGQIIRKATDSMGGRRSDNSRQMQSPENIKNSEHVFKAPHRALFTCRALDGESRRIAGTVSPPALGLPDR